MDSESTSYQQGGISMKYMTRSGEITGSDGLQDRFLQAVYRNSVSRRLIAPFLAPGFSNAVGRFLDSRFSACLVKPFARWNRIDLTDCEKKSFSSYNDFFTRRLRWGARPVDREPGALISPCDSLVSVYRISPGMRVMVKQTPYLLSELLRDEVLARRFEGGLLYVMRLCVDDYHRYVFPANGRQSGYRKIRGVLHTVNPAAADAVPIYKENSREYGILRTKEFGDVLMMEVGALMVGRICNHPGHRMVRCGEEKGYFAFGGSTIILMTQKGKVEADADLTGHTIAGYETKIRQGERIGSAIREAF